MNDITVKDLLDNCNCKLLIGNLDDKIEDCFIDSNKVIENSTFFGIKGCNVDGSIYYRKALENGAKICILNKITDLNLNGFDDRTIIITDDTKKVLYDIAMYKRSLFKGHVIGITGSVGKTTTKMMLANILKTKYKVLSTIGNQNSQIGVPLNILRLKDEDVIVLEMGMSKKGEMSSLSRLVKPDIAVITNVYDSHIENFGTKENILKAKLEITDYMNDGTLIINNDNDLLSKVVLNNVQIIRYGFNTDCDFKGHITGPNKMDVENIMSIKIDKGMSYMYNALACIKVAKMLGIEDNVIKDRIENFKNEEHRLELIKLEDKIIIDDTYNASLNSIKAALDYLSNFNMKRIVVLADVLELGNKSKEIHKQIGNLLSNYDIDILITIGKDSKNAYKRSKIKNKKHFKAEEKARKYVKKIFLSNSAILIKGSNGMKLENIVNYLTE